MGEITLAVVSFLLVCYCVHSNLDVYKASCLCIRGTKVFSMYWMCQIKATPHFLYREKGCSQLTNVWHYNRAVLLSKLLLNALCFSKLPVQLPSLPHHCTFSTPRSQKTRHIAPTPSVSPHSACAKITVNLSHQLTFG